MKDDEVYEVQRLYPQIFVACHTDHVRAVSTQWRISSQDASILVHLDREAGLSPSALAGHLSVAPSTLSAALARLETAHTAARRELGLGARGGTDELVEQARQQLDVPRRALPHQPDVVRITGERDVLGLRGDLFHLGGSSLGVGRQAR